MVIPMVNKITMETMLTVVEVMLMEPLTVAKLMEIKLTAATLMEVIPTYSVVPIVTAMPTLHKITNGVLNITLTDGIIIIIPVTNITVHVTAMALAMVTTTGISRLGSGLAKILDLRREDR